MTTFLVPLDSALHPRATLIAPHVFASPHSIPWSTPRRNACGDDKELDTGCRSLVCPGLRANTGRPSAAIERLSFTRANVRPTALRAVHVRLAPAYRSSRVQVRRLRRFSCASTHRCVLTCSTRAPPVSLRVGARRSSAFEETVAPMRRHPGSFSGRPAPARTQEHACARSHRLRSALSAHLVKEWHCFAEQPYPVFSVARRRRTPKRACANECPARKTGAY